MPVANSETMRYLRLVVFCLILILGFATSNDDERTKQSAIDKIKGHFFDLINNTRCVMISTRPNDNDTNDNDLKSIFKSLKDILVPMMPSRDQDMKPINHILKLIKCEYLKQEATSKPELKDCIQKINKLASNGGRRKFPRSSNSDTLKYSLPNNCQQLPSVLQACLEYNKQSYSCLSGNQLYALKRMCDGRNDCKDGSDEQRCAERVSELLQNTIRGSQVLRAALKMSNCTENFNASINRIFDVVTSMKVKENIHDTVEDLVQANNVFRETFCHSEKPFPIVFEEVLIRSTCVCQSGECKLPCDAICRSICEQRLLLAEFECPDGGGRTVPMASLCDGHPDCDDHSDEIHCSGNETNRKFMAYGQLRKLSEDLNNLMTSQGNSYVFPRLLDLQKNFLELQRNVTLKFARESVNVKIFESLENVLPRNIDINEINLNEINHLYNLLKILKNDLTLFFKLMGRAQKQESAGRDVEECQCYGSQCLAAECAVSCKRACAAHSAVLTYECSGGQKRIRIAALCDHKRQCPHGDDETQCATDKCQRYHFMAIIHDLKISEEFNGVFGETLKNWIKKATERIEIASKELTMPSRLDVLKLIEVLLNDLRTVYYNFFSSTLDVETKARNLDSPQIKLLSKIASKLVNRTKICQ